MERMRIGSVIWWVVLGTSLVACGEDNEAETGTETVEGSGARGGALYDKWWAVTGADEPTADHPLWASRPDAASNARSGADTWRCKECHGWDYEGVNGAYGSGSHLTGIAGIVASRMTAGEVVALLSDADGHGYASVMEAQDIADLAIFVTEWAQDTSSHIADDGTFVGDAAAGETVFGTTCATCHGTQGLNTTVVSSANTAFEDFPGLIASENPQEFLHKIRYGQPGTAMPALAESMEDSLGNLGAYAQTLPQTL